MSLPPYYPGRYTSNLNSLHDLNDYFQLPPLYALIIGISTYTIPEFRLHSAAKDADDFYNYLTSRLYVPHDHIINLRNEGATRAAIIKAFVQLEDMIPLAQKGDVGIVIYFAGHGTRCEKPSEWRDWMTVDNHIEAICPADIGVLSVPGENISGRIMFTQEGVKVPAIPDRTISRLLNRLSEARGNNITLVLDCCHSAGMHRDEDVSEPEKLGFVGRCIRDPPPMLPHYDDDIIGPSPRAAVVAQGFASKNNTSHVLLAACGQQQIAYEHPNKPNGVFTDSLLEVLTRCETEDLTYTSLIHTMNMPPWQNAHCDGAKVHRRLFNHRIQGAGGSYIPGTQHNETAFTLEAGTAQGISVGSAFSVHPTNLISLPGLQPNPVLGYLVASSVDTFSSHLTPAPNSHPFTLLNNGNRSLFYCKLIHRSLTPECLTISSPDLIWLQETITPEFCVEHSVQISTDTHSADLVLTLESTTGEICIDHNLPVVTQYIGTRSPFRIPLHKDWILPDLIQRVMNFRFHLLRTNPDVPDSIDVSVELLELLVEGDDDDDDDDNDIVAMPIGDNLLVDGVARVVVDEDNEKRYGVTIDNKTDIPLYPYLFYFDPSEFSIKHWYLPPTNTNTPSPTEVRKNAIIPPRSKFPIGYGGSDVHPWRFWIREGEVVDLGFFKLFLTTEPTSLRCIEQGSAYSALRSGEGAGSMVDGQRPEMGYSFWTAMSVMAVQFTPDALKDD